MSETFDKHLDGKRLGKQLSVVRLWMLRWGERGEWMTLHQIWTDLGYPEASISARLRDLRRLGYCVDKRRRGEPGKGIWEYQVSKPKPDTRQAMLFEETDGQRTSNSAF